MVAIRRQYLCPAIVALALLAPAAALDRRHSEAVLGSPSSLSLPTDAAQRPDAGEAPAPWLSPRSIAAEQGARGAHEKLAIDMPDVAARSKEVALPAAAGGDWLGQVQSDLASREYHASLNDEGLQAPNRAHNLRTYFERTGVRVVDRTAEGGPTLVELRVAAIGRGERTAEVEEGELVSAGARVEIRRPALVEWYENSAAGLEQGFTLPVPPSGEGPLVLELTLGQARAMPEEDRVILETPSGRQLAYGKLEVFDATGAAFPARLQVQERRANADRGGGRRRHLSDDDRSAAHRGCRCDF